MTKSPFSFIHNPPKYSDTFRSEFPKVPPSPDPSPHYLDTVPSHLLLKQTLGPLFILAKYIGIFPLEIDQDGVASFGFRQYSMLLYVLWGLVFIGLSAYYSPLYLELMKTQNSLGDSRRQTVETIHIIAKYLFVSGQFISAALVILGISRVAKRTASFYNRLNVIVTALEERGGVVVALNLRRVYFTSRVAVFSWVLIVICSLYLWWRSFHDYFSKEFKSKSELEYYAVVSGALWLAILIAGHVVPSFIFLGLASTMRAIFQSIHQQKLASQPNVKCGIQLASSSMTRLPLLLDIFAKLNTQMNRLGEIFGRYLIVEVISFFTAVLTNSFAVLTGFEKGTVAWETTSVSIIINFLWFLSLCEVGESVGRAQQRCLKSLKGWVVGAGIDGGVNSVEGTWLITTLLEDDVRGVSAANYFSIKRTLATDVVGAIVMYLIVMLQFKTQ